MFSFEKIVINFRLLFALLDIVIRLLARLRIESICLFILTEIFGGRLINDTLFLIESFGDALVTSPLFSFFEGYLVRQRRRSDHL